MDLVKMISEMTLEEKAGLCSGGSFWHLKGAERLGLVPVMVSDGPHGLRKQADVSDHLGVNISVEAVCFPTAAALACSFDRELLRELGEALGDACRAEGVSILLGPGANIKRSPLCGRNFEYFSEDPYLSSEMAASHISGVQSKGIGTSLKHFAANNQEQRRMSVSAEIDERTLRELYLASFEGAVKKAKPWTVMCSYNRINGVYASENERLLTDILRAEWGFDGYVMSDWGAVNDRVKGLEAGLELEMPSSGGVNDARIVEAVRSGELAEEVLDRAVERILRITQRCLENKREPHAYDKDAQHRLARRIETECAVLLKNEEAILPLSPNKKVAFIGKFAQTPRFQGGGSSHINATRTPGALDAVRDVCAVSYAQGYVTDRDETDPELLAQAVDAARKAEVAVVFAGLPDVFESEGYDRRHLSMPDCQNRLIAEIAKVQPNVVVVLHNGSPVEMPWLDDVKGVLELYLGGQAVGEAAVDLLFGRANPSGKLAETFPRKLADNPSYLFFPGEKDVSEYREGLFVGYRYYDAKQMEVLFPFGFGLSYTTFDYSNLRLSADEIDDTQTLTVTVSVKNTGAVEGSEAVQLYVHDCECSVIRPIKELKGFAKVRLKPGEQKDVSFVLDKRSFAFYHTGIGDWYAEDGVFDLLVGRSSRDIVLSAPVTVHCTKPALPVLTLSSTVGDLLEIPNTEEMVQHLRALYDASSDIDSEAATMGESTAQMMESMMRDMPLHALVAFSQGKVTHADLEQLVAQVNHTLLGEAAKEQ